MKPRNGWGMRKTYLSRLPKTARIIGTGLTSLGKLGTDSAVLIEDALKKSLDDAKLSLNELDGLIAVPSLSHPRFMEAHYIATKMGLLPYKPNSDFVCRTIDTGGAGPISGLLEARRMILNENCSVVAVVAGDAVSSMGTKKFLERADHGVSPPDDDPSNALKSPMIPHGYGRYTNWQMENRGVTREQLAMVSVLMSRQASRHPLALTKTPHSLQDVLQSPKITPEINLLECARRADGAGCVIVASSSFLQRKGRLNEGNDGSGDVVIVAGGESAGSLYPPRSEKISEASFSVENAARLAFNEANVSVNEIDWWGLYDCFPICFLRALEAVGLAKKGEGGKYTENLYRKTMDMEYTPNDFPINTHGGLLGFGAPWEVPAIYNVIEAVTQMSNKADTRQVRNVNRALVYGNGGIFSASAVAILAKPSNQG